ncbi:response regulator transcription factor [Salinisphaera sp. Q1T1-3]|uniref:response regulator transcription factor n=1 Tax=Salinisphaera sp. Q1T1-3 TaxID=2321229 RepID=UPI000E724562|nr:response regulator [Salinisphaera sp. Q1T1-3]RJS93497.1 response regulator [Salinisphaera sp. Q1T1-3]
MSALHILLVDDDPVFTRTLSRALARLGHEVTVAASPDAALAEVVAVDAVFDAAIIDLRLGDRSGLALIAPLLAEMPALRILMLTGYASIATAIEAIKRGAFNYLPKPAGARQILAALAHDGVADAALATHETPTSLRRLEWEHIQHVLAEHSGNVSATARALGMHRRTLQRKLAKRPTRESGARPADDP